MKIFIEYLGHFQKIQKVLNIRIIPKRLVEARVHEFKQGVKICDPRLRDIFDNLSKETPRHGDSKCGRHPGAEDEYLSSFPANRQLASLPTAPAQPSDPRRRRPQLLPFLRVRGHSFIGSSGKSLWRIGTILPRGKTGVKQNGRMLRSNKKACFTKKSGEPGRTRTSNPLLKRQLLYH
jgi:hypothetical protein